MAGYEKEFSALLDLDIAVVAASVDPIDKAREVGADLSFPVGYGVTREIADQLGAWWEERRQIIQPAEFILGEDNKVLASSYSDGPLGRIESADVVKIVNFYESQKS